MPRVRRPTCSQLPRCRGDGEPRPDVGGMALALHPMPRRPRAAPVAPSPPAAVRGWHALARQRSPLASGCARESAPELRRPDMTHVTRLCAAVLLLGGVTALRSQTKDEKPFNDADFVKIAASAGMHEIEISNLPQTKARNDAVTKFAETLVNDHTNMTDALNT